MQSLDVDTMYDDVSRALAPLHIEELCVEVMDELIYLHGLARSYEVKHEAAEKAEQVAPGYLIENEIRVAHGGVPSDGDLRAHVMEAIRNLGLAETHNLRVEVQDGIVHLSGTLPSAEARRTIEGAVWEVDAVTRVECHLSNEALPDDDRAISAALGEYVARAINLQPGVVSVDYVGGAATLSGFVESDTKARAIEDLIRWHDRVDDVVSNLRVGVPPSLAPPASR